MQCLGIARWRCMAPLVDRCVVTVFSLVFIILILPWVDKWSSLFYFVEVIFSLTVNGNWWTVITLNSFVCPVRALFLVNDTFIFGFYDLIIIRTCSNPKIFFYKSSYLQFVAWSYFVISVANCLNLIYLVHS